VLAGFAVARAQRIPFVADFRDPWIGRYDFGSIPPGLLGRLLRRLHAMVVHKSSAITCTAPGLRRVLIDGYPRRVGRVSVIRNGFDGDLAHGPPIATDHRLVILFAGEIYMNRDPFPFLEAVERFACRAGVDLSRVRIRFVGNCEDYRGRSLPQWLVGKRSEAIVEILPRVARVESDRFTAEATVLLNLAQNQPDQIPAKTYDYIGSRREILLLCEGDSDTARLTEGVVGITRVDPLDATGLDKALGELYQRHVVEGRSLAPDPATALLFARHHQSELFAALLESIAPELGNYRRAAESLVVDSVQTDHRPRIAK
jgi:hypothetical protein